jgi:hypothetical protein
MKKRMNENVVKGILILSVFITLTLKSCAGAAQSHPEQHRVTYFGFDVAFGTRSFKLSSDIDKINGMNIQEEGATIGLLLGNKIWQTKLRQGYFYSSACVPYTTELIETELNININPLQMIKVRFRSVEPYITTGVERNAIRLHGNYVSKDRAADAGGANRSFDEQSYLGRIVVTRASVGAGLQYRIPYQHSFLRLFAEARYGYALTHGTHESWFKHTSVSNQVAVSAGVCFGYLHGSSQL